MRRLTRREVLLDSMWAAAAAAAARSGFAEEAPAKPAGPNDRLRVAVIGVHSRGRNLVGDLLHQPDVDIPVICDCDSAVVGPPMEEVEKARGAKPRFVQDFRRVLEDKDIDAIATATPNHWHALLSIWACQAGKDVYVEKPVSHNVREGRRIIEAARKHKRIVQTGTQVRSSAGVREAIEFLRGGGLGKIRVARGLCYKPRKSIGSVAGPVKPPDTADYNLWLGPAPEKPLHRTQFHYDWHWQWDYGNGDLGNQGIHQMDIARWGLGEAGFGTSVVSAGGRLGYKDDGETANTQIVAVAYPGGRTLVFEVRGLDTADYRGAKVGVVFECEKGWMVNASYSGAAAFDADGKPLKEFHGGGDHMRNFVDAVKARDASKLHAPIEEGHVSSALCHLGNISYRLGEARTVAKDTKPFADDAVAQESFDRMREHLASQGVDVAKEPVMIGARLTVDPAKEDLPGNAPAQAMLTREYRKGFVVPEVL